MRADEEGVGTRTAVEPTDVQGQVATSARVRSYRVPFMTKGTRVSS